MLEYLKSFKLFFNIALIVVIGAMASHMESQSTELENAKTAMAELENSHKADSETIKRLEKTLDVYTAELEHLRQETEQLKTQYTNSNKALKKKIMQAKTLPMPEQMSAISEILYDDIIEYRKEIGVEK